MIRGIGVDIAEVSRFEKIAGHQRFLDRCFTMAEQAYLAERGAAMAQSMAGLFAAKEAVLKALGTGLGGVSLRDIEITHDALRAPGLVLHGTARASAEARGAFNYHLSISHEAGLAVALVVLEGKEP